jgi:hypothetical protein
MDWLVMELDEAPRSRDTRERIDVVEAMAAVRRAR